MTLSPRISFARFVIVTILLVVCVSSIANGQSARVQLEPSKTYTESVSAIRDNQPTSIQFRTIGLHVRSSGGRVRRFLVYMLYDSQSKLFFWAYYEMNQDYSVEWSRGFADATVYLSHDKLIRFSNGIGGVPLTTLESAERKNTIEQAQDDIIHFFEKEPLTPPDRNRKEVWYLKQVPRDFLKECVTDVVMPFRIETMRYEGKLWHLTLRVQNGNAVEISLDDSYNLISTKFFVNPDADSIGGCKR